MLYVVLCEKVLRMTLYNCPYSLTLYKKVPVLSQRESLLSDICHQHCLTCAGGGVKGETNACVYTYIYVQVYVVPYIPTYTFHAHSLFYMRSAVCMYVCTYVRMQTLYNYSGTPPPADPSKLRIPQLCGHFYMSRQFGLFY